MSAVSFTVAVPLLAVLAAATFSDLRMRRIPNGLTFGGAALGLLINAAAFGPYALGIAAIGWALCLVCMLPFYMGGGMAAGDVKLMAMVGAFLGPINGFAAFLITLVIGAALAVFVLVWRKLVQTRQPLLSPATNIGELAEPEPTSATQHAQLNDKIPYAAAIALGSLAAVARPVWTNLF